MGKPTAKKKMGGGYVNVSKGSKNGKGTDDDTAVFIGMSQELKEEGNRLFQKRDHEGAMLKYEKALKLLPKNHIDVAYLRSNMAGCYMQLGLGEYPRAINECNMALEVSPKYSKALLKRAKCYEALNRLDLALRDVNHVLSMEPSNVTALEIADSVKRSMIDKGIHVVEDKEMVSAHQKIKQQQQVAAAKTQKKKKIVMTSSCSSSSDHAEEKKVVLMKDDDDDHDMNKSKVDDNKQLAVEQQQQQQQQQQLVLKKSIKELDEKPKRMIMVKLVLGDDIRLAQLPHNCSMKFFRQTVINKFPNLKGGLLVKYKDEEGDLVTVTTTSDLRMAEEASSKHHQAVGAGAGSSSSSSASSSLRLSIVEVSPEKEPTYEGSSSDGDHDEYNNKIRRESIFSEDTTTTTTVGGGGGGGGGGGPICVEDWIVQFARMFKNHVGFDSDSYLDLHQLGMKLYSEAMEETVTSEDAQHLFDVASNKFQEMAALALFNWGNVHMSRVRKQVFFSDENPRETILAKIKVDYEWALKEYLKAGSRYEEALKIKKDFYEAFLALGRQQFEQAKLCWYYAIVTSHDNNNNNNNTGTGGSLLLEEGPAAEVLMLYNKAEDSIEKGMQIWEEMEERRLNGNGNGGVLDESLDKAVVQKMGLDGVLKAEISADEALKQASNLRSQIYLMWGTLLYERSVVEYRLELPTWEECLEVAVEKFELGGASPTDIAVMIKNHCSNDTALQGFKIDEVVHAWNEMYDAKKWQIGVPAFRLEPLFRRQVSKLHSALEHRTEADDRKPNPRIWRRKERIQRDTETSESSGQVPSLGRPSSFNPRTNKVSVLFTSQ